VDPRFSCHCIGFAVSRHHWLWRSILSPALMKEKAPIFVNGANRKLTRIELESETSQGAHCKDKAVRTMMETNRGRIVRAKALSSRPFASLLLRSLLSSHSPVCSAKTKPKPKLIRVSILAHLASCFWQHCFLSSLSLCCLHRLLCLQCRPNRPNLLQRRLLLLLLLLQTFSRRRRVIRLLQLHQQVLNLPVFLRKRRRWQRLPSSS